MKKLEQIIKDAERFILDKLKDGEMEEQEYYNELRDYFENRGLKRIQGVELGITLQINALDLLQGFRKTYISRYDVPLSKETQEDILKLHDIEEAGAKYIKEKYGKSQITKKEFEDTVFEYMNSEKMPYRSEDLMEIDKSRLIGIMLARLKKYANIIKE